MKTIIFWCVGHSWLNYWLYPEPLTRARNSSSNWAVQVQPLEGVWPYSSRTDWQIPVKTLPSRNYCCGRSSATKLRRLCFYTCLSVHGGGGGGLPQCMLRYHPQEQTPPWEQTPPRTRPPWEQTPPSRWLLLQMVRILLERILVTDRKGR